MLPNEINISSDRFLIIEHPEITIPRKPSFLRRLEQTISSIVAWPRGRQTWKSVFFLVQTRGFEMQQEQGRGGGRDESTGAFDEKNIPAESFFSFPFSLFFFFRRDTSSMTRTEADSAQKTSLRLRAGAGSRCYLLDMGRCFARCRYIPLTNYSTDPRLSTMRCRWLLNEALKTRSSIEGVGVKVWTDGSFPWFP